MFSARSRYSGSDVEIVASGHDSFVAAIRIPIRARPASVGRVRPTDDVRADHVAARHLQDPTAFWRLCDAAGAMSPDALMRRNAIDIPVRER